MTGGSDSWVLDRATARDVMRRWYDAWNAHDVDAVLALVTDDLVYEDPAAPEPVAHGREAARAAFEFHHGYCPNLSLEAHEIWANEENSTIATWFTFRGTFTGVLQPPGFAGSGQAILSQGMDRSELRDGLIARHQIFSDTLGAARELGLFPPRGGVVERGLARAQRAAVRLRTR